MSYNEKVTNFYLEWLQSDASDTDWLIRKYGFESVIVSTDNGGLTSLNGDGEKLITLLSIKISPVEIVKARKNQSDHPDKFPWKLKKPLSQTAKT